jgi:hypothetical protein
LGTKSNIRRAVVFGSAFTGFIAGAGGGFTLPHSLKTSSARADELTKLQIIDAAIAIVMVANSRPIASSSQVSGFSQKDKETKRQKSLPGAKQ